MAIWTLNELEDPSGIFAGHAGDVFGFQGKMPEISVFSRFSTDPAFRDDLLGEFTGLDTGQGRGSNTFLGRMAMYNTAEVLRINVGRLATTVGFLTQQIGNLRNLFRDPLESIAMALDVAKRILNSDWFQSAMDAIGWIPIVGWILKVIVEVADIIVWIIDIVKDKRAENARAALAKVPTIPMAEWSAGADNALAKILMLRIADYDLQWCFEPRYPAGSPGDFVARQEEVNPDDDCWSGWLLSTRRDGASVDPDEGAPGLGLIPGTRNLHGAIEFRTAGGGNLKDLGEFYPTVRMAGVQLWEMLVGSDTGRPGPAIMAVDTGRARDKWASYIESAWRFGNDILDGWSMSQTATEMGATTHLLSEKCGAKHSKRGKRVDIPGHGHQFTYLQYIDTLFNLQREDPDAPWGVDNINFDGTTPALALANLRGRQEAMLMSIDCMYVDDSVMPNGQPRFRAIGTPTSKGPMYNRWIESVQSVFDTGDWKRVRWADVPDGTLRNELNKACNNAGIKCEDLGKVGGWLAPAGPSSLGDPVPPAPNPPTEVELAHVVIPGDGKKKKKKVSGTAAALAVAAVAGGLLLAKR